VWEGEEGRRQPRCLPSACCPPALQHHCTVPTYSCAVTALAIHPLTNNLVIAYSDQQVGALPVAALTAPSPRLSAWPRGFLAAPLGRRAVAPDRHRDPAGLRRPWQDAVPTQHAQPWTPCITASPPSCLSSCLSSASPRSSTRPGAARCRTAGCTRPGWRGTRPSPTSPSTPRTPRTSCSTTSTCSASSTSPW